MSNFSETTVLPNSGKPIVKVFLNCQNKEDAIQFIKEHDKANECNVSMYYEHENYVKAKREEVIALTNKFNKEFAERDFHHKEVGRLQKEQWKTGEKLKKAQKELDDMGG